MPGQDRIQITVMGVQKDTCPCCVGGEIARVLGSTADCICGHFVGKLKKHAQKGLPVYHACLRDITGRGRLYIYMLQKDTLHVELTLFGFPTNREMVEIDAILRPLGDNIMATYSDYGYKPEELNQAEEPYDGPPMEKQGLVMPEERLAKTLAEGSLWGESDQGPERPPRPVPPELTGHR